MMLVLWTLGYVICTRGLAEIQNISYYKARKYCKELEKEGLIEHIREYIPAEFDKLKQENDNFKRSYYNSELSGLKAENELFKDTIVAMATYTYPGISNFDKIFRNINHNLEMIRKGERIKWMIR